MRVAVISDVHCAGPDDPIQAEFIGWLDALEADGLWLLGDIFHWGWAFSGTFHVAIQPVVDALQRVQERGIDVLFVGGNHDFAVATTLGRMGIEVRQAHHRSLDGRGVFVAHGDEADQSVGYRLTQWLLRGRLFAWVIRMAGEVRGSWILARLAGDQKTDLFEASDRRGRDWLKTQLVGETTLAMCGHFHLASRETHDEGEVVTLGAGGPRAVIWLKDGEVQ